MFWLPHIATSESVGLRCGPNLAVFVPVFWCLLCRRPLAGGGLGCVAVWVPRDLEAAPPTMSTANNSTNSHLWCSNL